MYRWFKVCSACVIAFNVDFFAFLFWRCCCRCHFRLTVCVSLFCFDDGCLAFFGWLSVLAIVVGDVCVLSLWCWIVMVDFVFSHICLAL